MISLRIIFAGSGEFGLPTLKALHDAGHNVVQVISQPDRPAGRGRTLTPTPVAQYAIERSLPLARTADINAEALAAADLMIVIAFGQKIAEHVVHHARLGSVNLHASRLPKYRGAAPINWAIINGETVAGNSIIRLAPKMDAGAVLAQSELAIGEIETAGELHDRLAQDGVHLILDVINALAKDRATEMPQDETQATLAPKLRRESAIIDWTRPAAQIAQQIRGMSPWPSCRARLLDSTGKELNRVTLLRARTSEDSNDQPGTILPNLTISARQSSVQILELQPEGKRPMSLDAFRNGHPWSPTMPRRIPDVNTFQRIAP